MIQVESVQRSEERRSSLTLTEGMTKFHYSRAAGILLPKLNFPRIEPASLLVQ